MFLKLADLNHDSQESSVTQVARQFYLIVYKAVTAPTRWLGVRNWDATVRLRHL
jgi:hypothetical protein